MNDIQKFTNEEFGTIRVADNNGEPWFVAKDVCDALGIATNHLRERNRGLDDDEVVSLPNWEGKGSAPLIVSEPGFYKLVMKSRKPEAKAFQRWVTHEVLPSIRKQGAYVYSNGTESDDVLMARGLLAAQTIIDKKNAVIEGQQREIAELRPKALFADAVAASDGTCLIGELAKMMRQNGVHVGQNRLFEWLRRDGFLGKTGSNYNVPTQMAMERGLFRIKETAVTHSDGHVTVNRTPKATGRGQRYFIDRYCKA